MNIFQKINFIIEIDVFLPFSSLFLLILCTMIYL